MSGDYIYYPINPVSAPRQVKRDKWNPSKHVQNYRAFRDEVRIRNVEIPLFGYHIIFLLPMPKSWSLTRKQEKQYTPHLQRPDKDNLEKALLDAAFGEDSHIYDGRVSKLWDFDGGILIAEDRIDIDVKSL